jgi:hypothetical protein
MKLTYRQQQVLDYVKRVKVCSSGNDGSVLRALEKKGFVLRHHNNAPGYTWYTWTLANQSQSSDIEVSK